MVKLTRTYVRESDYAARVIERRREPRPVGGPTGRPTATEFRAGTEGALSGTTNPKSAMMSPAGIANCHWSATTADRRNTPYAELPSPGTTVGVWGQVDGDRLYQAPTAPIDVILSSLSAPLAFDEWHEYLLSSHGPYERICLDRYITILNRLLLCGLPNCSLLDLGCSSGFFASAFALTLASQVTAVEDERAAAFGYRPDAFLQPLRAFVLQHGLKHIEVVDKPIESFLAVEADRRQWDVVLCLSVLHHYHTGYGDHVDVGALEADRRYALYQQLGAVTRRLLYLEIDSTRIGSQEQFFSDLCDLGRFHTPIRVGWSCSAPGDRRAIWELMKFDD